MEIQYLNPESKTNKPCIFKLYAKKKYVIVKTMEISPLIANLKEQLAREVRTFKEGSIFSKLVKEIVRTGHTVLGAEIVSTPETRLDLLIEEYNMLKEAKEDKNCLNVSFSNHDYYPRWIDQTTINEFKEYYTKGNRVGSSVKDKKLRRFIRNISQKDMYLDDFVDKVCSYVKENYK